MLKKHPNLLDLKKKKSINYKLRDIYQTKHKHYTLQTGILPKAQNRKHVKLYPI